jgi:hypothetical protein
MKKIILFLTLFVLLLSLVSAEEGIKLTEISGDSIVESRDEAIFVYSLENTGSNRLYLQLSADSYIGIPSNNFEYMFIEPNIVELQGHESVEVLVETKLKSSVRTGKRYKSFFTIKSLDEGGIDEVQNIEIFVKEPTSEVTMTIDQAPEQISAGSNFVAILNLENNLEEDISNVDIIATSDFFEEKTTVQLFERQQRDVELAMQVPGTTVSGEYTFSVRVYYDEELQSTDTQVFQVGEYSNIDLREDVQDGFLFKKTTATKTNDGNVIVSDSYNYDSPLFQGWFTAYNVKPSAKKAGEKDWFFNLAPGEDYIVTITIDYRPLVFSVLALIFLTIIVYYWHTNRVSIRKEVFKTKYGVDGLSAFKVLLHVKNKTSKPIKDLTLIDKLPKVITPRIHYGTVKPHGVERGEREIRMMWKIKELVSGEERIISYEVNPGMKVVGSLSLPQSLAKFKAQNKRIKRIRSNIPQIDSGVVEKVSKDKR